MGRTSDADQRLRRSARQLIYERGYHSVGIGEICADAGVNKGSFYYFYPSKQKLVLDVIDAAWHEARELLESTLLGEEPPPVRMRRYLEAIYARHREMFAACGDGAGRVCGCPLANLAAEMSTQDPLMRSRVQQTFEGHFGYYERWFEEAEKSGDLAPGLDQRQLAESLFALIEGKILIAKVRNDPHALRDLPLLAGRLLDVDL